MSKTPPLTVSSTGAAAGEVLVGIHANGNAGLLIQVFEPQVIGIGGRIRGPFKILHEGTGRYSGGIRSVIDNSAFFGRAQDFIAAVSLQKDCSECTHILNANALWKLDISQLHEQILSEPTEPHAQGTQRYLRCKTCGKTYDDLSLNFCLNDGSRLLDHLGEVPTVVLEQGTRRRRSVEGREIDYIRSAVDKHPSLSLKVHKGSNHRIMKSGHVGSVWIRPRFGGVTITANGESAPQLYREMERILGPAHREDEKGYKYYQANSPADVERVVEAWVSI